MLDRTIRNFQIKELIATGGMAAIYKAVQISLDRMVAIKVLHGHLAQDKNFITRFEREAKAAANLKHENIVNIIDYGQADDIYFIAMEYVEGKSLQDLIGSIKFIPHDIAPSISLEVCRGLNHAHGKGVVHRDIKPANILINHDGVIKITDFGLAQAQDLTSITVTGSIVGTPAYMSSEQAAGKKVDNGADIFSLGVILYEMITGTKPFHGKNYSSTIHAILTVTPPKPIEANPLVPREISDIIEKMLEKDLEKRYQTIAEVGDDISLYLRRNEIEVSRKDVSEFISTPAEDLQKILQRRKEQYFERGLYLMTLGYERIDDAINEFKKVLHLDPQNDEARKYLSNLQQKKEKRMPVKKEKAEIAAKKSILLPIGIIVIFLFIFLVAFFGIRRRRLFHLKKPSEMFGVVSITSVPESVSIYLDNNELGLLTPARIDSLATGEHTIELRKTGYKFHRETFSIRGGDTISLSALLETEMIEPRHGSITVRSHPFGATVFLDNVDMGLKTPCTIPSAQEGFHRIKIVKKGYKPIEVRKQVTEGKSTQVSVTLTSITREPAPREEFSFLKLRVNPWAKIFIDNKYVETTPIARPIKVLSGSRTVKLENPNFKIWQRSIDFNPGDTVTLDVKLQPVDGYLKLTVKPWADVYIDGKFYETTPIAQAIKLPAGKHTLRLVNPSFKPFEQQIEIPAHNMLKKHVELVPK